MPGVEMVQWLSPDGTPTVVAGTLESWEEFCTAVKNITVRAGDKIHIKLIKDTQLETVPKWEPQATSFILGLLQSLAHRNVAIAIMREVPIYGKTDLVAWRHPEFQRAAIKVVGKELFFTPGFTMTEIDDVFVSYDNIPSAIVSAVVEGETSVMLYKEGSRMHAIGLQPKKKSVGCPVQVEDVLPIGDFATRGGKAPLPIVIKSYSPFIRQWVVTFIL